jgi:hypothetical protein
MIKFNITNASPINFSAGARQGPAGGPGSGGSLSPIAARSLLGNATNATALPTGISDPAVLQSIVQCPSEAEFDSFVSLVGASFTAVDAALANRVLNTDTRLADSREWTATTISQAEAEAGIATARRAFTAQRVRQAIVGWWDEDSFGERLGLIYDLPNGQSALQCADSEWVFGNTSYRDNLRTALQAAAATHAHGNISNAGAIGSTADLPLSTTASGVINTRTVADFRALLGLATTNSPTFSGLTLNQGTANQSVLTSTGYSLTGSNAQSLVSLAGIWNTTGTPTAIDLNITDTASNAASLLLNLRTGGTSRVSIPKTGGIQFPTTFTLTGIFPWSAGANDDLILGPSLSTVLRVSRFGLNGSPGINLQNGAAYCWSSAAGPTNAPSLMLFQDSANTFAQRNGTNAQISRIYKTFTSSTNFETYEVDAAGDAANYRIGHRTGSVNNTVRGLQFGEYNGAGAWTSWLGIDTSGRIGIGDAPGILYRLSVSQADTALVEFVNTSASSSGGGAGIIGFHKDGAALASGDRLGFFLLGGSTSASGTNNSVGLVGFATENWSTTSCGARMDMTVQPNGTAGAGSRVTAMSWASNGIAVLSIADSAAANSTFYFSTTQNKLVYKDSGGTVNVLY